MGMFNYVDYECECPVCGETVTGFKTHDGLNLDMRHVAPQSVYSFTANCRNCEAYLAFNRVKAPPKFDRTVEVPRGPTWVNLEEHETVVDLDE